MGIQILSSAFSVPENCVTNDDLAKKVDTSDEWIRSRTGIGARFIAEHETTSDLGYAAAAKAIVDLIEEGHQVIITHGNGPQVGMINNAMAGLSREDANQPNTPLSVCVAMSQAYIGYDLQNALREELLNRNITDIPVTTMITQIRVDAEDPAFNAPSKPIGHFMTEEQAKIAEEKY